MKLMSWFYKDFLRFDTVDIVTGLYALKYNHFEAFDTPEAHLVLDAIRRSTIELGPDADIHEIADYIQSYDEVQMEGLASNIKGIFHELNYVYEENQDLDQIRAEMMDQTNYPDSDVVLINTETGDREYVQLKATDDVSYVRETIEENPDIRVISTEELAEELNIDSSGMFNEELNQQVESVLNELEDTHTLWEKLPQMSMWTLAFSIAPVLRQYRYGHISKQVCISRITQITGMKLTRVLVLVFLLSFPLTAMPTSIYLVMKYTMMVMRTLNRKEVYVNE